ncbi:hypothetical protein CRYPA_17 [uncultured Candidatus Thioglobus sp.]|nr:hypothetical protein CRYPA_17 [uncultured Candidatus Thioglobus sp.]
MKKLLTAILATLPLTLQAASTTPPDGKMTLYYEDGSKKIEKKYKDGRPVGTWTRWYENGKIWGVVDFETATLSDYEPHSSIVKIDMRYSDKDNSIRYKGEAFKSKLVWTKDNSGKDELMPMWDYISNSYGQDGNILEEEEFVVELTDDLTGKMYHFPWLGWQNSTDTKSKVINE